MKVTVNKEEKKAKNEYPCLMIHTDGTVVLFLSDGAGVAVDAHGSTRDFHYGQSWWMKNFKPFTGSITLEND